MYRSAVEFSVIHKVDNAYIFVLPVFENMMDREIGDFTCNSMTK